MEKITKIIIASSVGVVLTTALVIYVKKRGSNSASNMAFRSDVAPRVNQTLTPQSQIQGATDAHNSSVLVAPNQSSTPIQIHY